MHGKHTKSFKPIFIHLLAIIFSILFDSSFGFSLRPCYALAIYLLLITISPIKHLFSIVTVSLSAISSLYAPISFLYGSPNINILLSIGHSNFSESLEFLLAIPFTYYLFSATVIFIALVLLKNSSLLDIKYRNLTLFILLSILLFRPIYSATTKGEVEIDFTPVKFIKRFYDAAITVNKENTSLKSLINKKPTLTPTNASDKFDTYILVVGESARRDFMEAYGFKINNTPFMSSVKGIIFNKYISAASSTQMSLSTSFSVQNKPQNNLIRLAQGQGLDTWWISNQGSYGDDDFQISAIGKQADHPVFIKKGEYDATNHDDVELLPYIKTALQTNTKNKLIVVHLMGSHSNFCTRTANKYDEFYVNKTLSCYVQTIKNTDILLSHIAKAANEENKKWTLMYFSDHGLSFVGKENESTLTLTHGDKTKQNFSVPLFITSYDSTKRVVRELPYSAMNFLSLYLFWTGSSENTITQTCNPIEINNCRNNEIKVIDFDHNIKSFSDLINEPVM